ncbi:hypothetical protein AnigIFM63309_001283 [Aspergillus niger]|nr:hypothetical protein AnigIFM63309_001283 [Aspergillus niger]
MPTSTLLWSVGSLALSSMVLPAAASSYELVETWKGEDFLTAFDFYTGADPTNGFVTYANQSYAESTGLVKVNSNGTFYMGVDHTTKLSTNGPGRESVRIGSNKYYDEGLFIIDLQHMPGSVCGTWPAFWSTGKNWPTDGEIDIIEGVNKNEANEIVLHTSGTCQVSSQKMSGTLTSTECGEDAGTTGCVVEGTQGSSGTPFNENGGGVYAMQWTDEFLKFWFFPRGSIPSSITKGDPDVAAFGTPMAHMEGSCSIAEHFKAQQFIFDTTFCGDWAGGVYSTSGCPVSDSSSSFKSCVAYVAENPTAFAESYWEINYIKIYQTGVAASASASASHVESAASVAETISAVREGTNSVVATTTAATIAVTSTADAETATTMAEATTVAASTETSAADENGSSASTSTHYVTMTTTICPIAESSSAAAALADGSSEATEASNSEGSPAAATPSSVTGASAEANESESTSAAVTTPSTATGASAEANGSESSSASEAGSVAGATPSSVSTTGASGEADSSESASAAATPSNVSSTGASAEANGSEDSSASSEAKTVAPSIPSSVTGASAEANGNDSASSNAATASNVSGASAQAGDNESTPASAGANAGSSAAPSSVTGASAEANGSEGSSSHSSGSQAGAHSYGSVPSSAAAYGRPAPSSSSHAFATAPSSTGSSRVPTSAAAANNAAAATQGSSASGSNSGSSGHGSSSATTPSTPVFTGGANKLTLGASSVLSVLAFALLA